jgi:hypothetical protein
MMTDEIREAADRIYPVAKELIKDLKTKCCGQAIGLFIFAYDCTGRWAVSGNHTIEETIYILQNCIEATMDDMKKDGN